MAPSICDCTIDVFCDHCAQRAATAEMRPDPWPGVQAFEPRRTPEELRMASWADTLMEQFKDPVWHGFIEDAAREALTGVPADFRQEDAKRFWDKAKATPADGAAVLEVLKGAPPASRISGMWSLPKGDPVEDLRRTMERVRNGEIRFGPTRSLCNGGCGTCSQCVAARAVIKRVAAEIRADDRAGGAVIPAKGCMECGVIGDSVCTDCIAEKRAVVERENRRAEREAWVRTKQGVILQVGDVVNTHLMKGAVLESVGPRWCSVKHKGTICLVGTPDVKLDTLRGPRHTFAALDDALRDDEYVAAKVFPHASEGGPKYITFDKSAWLRGKTGLKETTAPPLFVSRRDAPGVIYRVVSETKGELALSHHETGGIVHFKVGAGDAKNWMAVEGPTIEKATARLLGRMFTLKDGRTIRLDKVSFEPIKGPLPEFQGMVGDQVVALSPDELGPEVSARVRMRKNLAVVAYIQGKSEDSDSLFLSRAPNEPPHLRVTMEEFVDAWESCPETAGGEPITHHDADPTCPNCGTVGCMSGAVPCPAVLPVEPKAVVLKDVTVSLVKEGGGLKVLGRPKRSCDCGAAKARTTHAEWCSLEEGP